MYIGKPEVRIIEDQSEEIRPADVSSYEVQQLLQKYGYSSPVSRPIPSTTNNRTFEDLVREQEMEQERIRKMKSRPVNPSFRGDYHHRTHYRDAGDFSMKVEIFTDMPLPDSD